MKTTRRNHLATMGSALLGASVLSTPAEANGGGPGKQDAEVLYGHGQVWNRDLPGALAELRLSFDLRVNLETGAGFGTASDPVFPDANVHFAINSTVRQRMSAGETRYTMEGVVTHANNAASVGLPVRILAQTEGDTTAIAIAVGNLAFAGAGLVVIAIIGVLIGLLLPAVQA